MTPSGLLLAAHGTRDPEGIAEFRRLVSLVEKRVPDVEVMPAFIELAEPNVVEGIRRLEAKRVEPVVVAPLLLFAAGHAKLDIPRAVAEAKRITRLSRIEEARHLGCHAKILELSRRNYHDATSDLPPAAKTDTVLILVGRGSRDPEATSEMLRFAGQRQTLDPRVTVRTAFLAMASPSLDEVLRDVSRLPARRIIVQPHLLFQGALLRDLRSRVDAMNERSSGRRWRMASHLGPTREVAEAVVDRFLECLRLAECTPRGPS